MFWNFLTIPSVYVTNPRIRVRIHSEICLQVADPNRKYLGRIVVSVASIKQFTNVRHYPHYNNTLVYLNLRLQLCIYGILSIRDRIS